MEKNDKALNKGDNEEKGEEGFTKPQWIGMIVGFGIAAFLFQLEQFGFIPAFLIAYGGYWVFKEIAEAILEDNEKPDNKEGNSRIEVQDSNNKKEDITKKLPSSITNVPKRMTLDELINFIYSSMLDSATKISEMVIEDKQIKEKEKEKRKLKFDLMIALLTVSSNTVMNYHGWDYDTKTSITGGIVNLYLDKLREEKSAEDSVEASFFIRDEEEVSFFCEHVQSDSELDKDNFQYKTSLHTIALNLWMKRSREYQKLYKSDLEKISREKSNFLPKMTGKVYKHYSGRNPQSYEGIIFSIFVFRGFSIFANFLSKSLSKIQLEK